MAGKTKTEAANHLRAWRTREGLSQSELAEKVGTKASVISELESGVMQLSPKWLRKFAPIFRITEGQLLDFDPDQLAEAQRIAYAYNSMSPQDRALLSDMVASIERRRASARR